MSDHLITLNDYIYSGDTVPKILQMYSAALKQHALSVGNTIDMMHSNFILEMESLLEHNDFLTSQSQRIREFYKYMAAQYPYLAFTFRGRIKSVVRTEEKFNGYVVEYIYRYYTEHGSFPDLASVRDSVMNFHDLIAYRIVISLPRCHLKPGEDQKSREQALVYEIANVMPGFLEAQGFTAQKSGMSEHSPLLSDTVAPYYRDYIYKKKDIGYQSLHITFFDNSARCPFEIQLRTKEMDDFAEIGKANHADYEKQQEKDRRRRGAVPEGECPAFDEAYERGILLQELDLSNVDVNMFSAVNNHLINDGCGFFRGRQILPYEHLSRFQNDLVD